MKLFTKLIEPKTHYVLDIELKIIQNKKDVIIKCLNYPEIKMLLYPICTETGIKLDKIVFPIHGKIKNNKYYFYFNYVFKLTNILKNIDIFPDFFLSQIYQNLNFEINENDKYFHEQNLIEDLKVFNQENFLLEDLLLKTFQLPLKLKNYVIHTNHIPKNLISIYQTNSNIMFNGQYFNNLQDLLNLKPNDVEMKYKNKIKNLEGQYYFFSNEEKLNNLLELFLLEFNYEDIIKKFLEKEFNGLTTKLNNLVNLYYNFYQNNLSIFQIILFIISNDINLTSNNTFYQNILGSANKILKTEDFITLDEINFYDLPNFKIFIEKYSKFKSLLFKKSIPKINFTLNYNKKNIDENIEKLIYLFNNDINKQENKELLRYFKPKIRNQMEIIFSDKINFSNEKIYRDYTLRLYIKKYFLDNKDKLSDFNKFNFFRFYFAKMKWKDIVNNFELINMMSENSHILLYYGKINNVIFTDNYFKDIISIIKNKFRVLDFLDSHILVYDFLILNYSDLGMILENFTNLSNQQLKNLSKIIFLSKFIENYESKSYQDFITLCSKNNFLITNNKFNLKIKNYLNNNLINYGKIVRDINQTDKNKKIRSPYQENYILKKLYLRYRKKYSKYKAKYFLEKEKNNPNYKLKRLSIFNKQDK